MGRILAGVLFVTACVGDRTEVGPPYSGGVDTTPGTTATVTRYAPQACGEMSWHVTNGGPVSFGVVARAADVQVMSVPQAGGAISAFTFDKAANLTKVDPAIQLGRGMTSVSASLVGTFPVATSADASALHITALSADLSTALPLAQVAPGLVARTALQTAGTQLVMPVADDQGLRVETFDTAWNPTTLRVATTEPAVAMTAASMRDATVAAWSTASSCHAIAMSSAEATSMVTVPGACLAPALAIDPSLGLGAFVFEGNDGVRMLEWSQSGFRGVSQLLTVGGSSPRAIFDGQRIWISMLDDSDHLIVGYLDNGTFVAITLTTRPMAAQYDLVVMDGAVWAVSLGSDAYLANRLCVEPTNG